MLTRRRSKLSGAELTSALESPSKKPKRKTNTPSPAIVAKKRSTTRKVVKKSTSNENDTKAIQSPQPQNGIAPQSNPQSREFIACYKAIEHVLAMNYVDVHKRLTLTYPVKCTQALEECSENHARNHVNTSNQFPFCSRLFINFF